MAHKKISHVAENFIQAHYNDLMSFWEIEEVPGKPKILTDKRQVEQHFDDTTQRKPHGRSVVDLHRSNSTMPLGE